MMSQQRTRKAMAVEAGRGRQTAKASGDGMSSKVQPKQPTARSKSKSKIPKSLRYDLENALVGLCDVWFEDIKPHLVRNNIKVHVHGEGPASGDHQRLPPGAPGCSHLDPASSASVCELCRLLFNAANSIESAVSQAASVVPAGMPAPNLVAFEASDLPSAKIPRNSRPRRLRNSRSRPQSQPQASSNWRTPRLCRTYSILTPRTNPPERRLHTADPRMSRRKQYKHHPKMIDKSTQTPSLRKPEVMPICQEDLQQELFRQKLYNRNIIGQERSPQETIRPRAYSPSGLRCSATTNMRRSRKQPPPPMLPLFQDDLIDIIAEKSDHQLRVLFSSPTQTHASSLTLFQPHAVRRLAPSKKNPWR